MPQQLPQDHRERITRARLALDGLSVGDAFGNRFFTSPANVESLVASRAIPTSPWYYTDDTVMALGILEVLDDCGRIDQNRLATVFAHRYQAQPDRGYGGTAQRILREIGQGTPWRTASTMMFSGTGSKGNGGAMRVAPPGRVHCRSYGGSRSTSPGIGRSDSRPSRRPGWRNRCSARCCLGVE